MQQEKEKLWAGEVFAEFEKRWRRWPKNRRIRSRRLP